MHTTFSKEEIINIRKRFPILSEKIYGKDLVYLDNTATTQKPVDVIEALGDYYKSYNSNVHRGVHHLSQKATDAYEKARKKVQQFIGASLPEEVIFTSGTTESINLVAQTFAKDHLKKGDSVMISAMEHHSNIVPWQMICEEKNAKLKIIPVTENGELYMPGFEKLLDKTVKIISLTYVSNTLGTVNPVKQIISKAHEKNIPVMLDAAQAVQHFPVNVQELDADFIAFSGHKMYGPTGIGVLYGKEKWLKKLPPYKGGGDMIKTVTFEKTTYNDLPYKFEAGTPNIADAIGLAKAIDVITGIGLHRIHDAEQELLKYATGQLKTIPTLRIIGEAKEKAAVISFLLGNAHPFDTGEILDKQGIAVRTGHHCTEPLMDFFKIPGTVRASFSFYNTREEVDALVKALRRIDNMLN